MQRKTFVVAQPEAVLALVRLLLLLLLRERCELADALAECCELVAVEQPGLQLSLDESQMLLVVVVDAVVEAALVGK
jgi:hypothetical protein